MEDSKYSAKVIVETGLMVAITLIIIMTTSFVPIISSLGMFILPIPITLLYIRHNYKIALIVVVMSIILTGILINPISALVSGIAYGFAGTTLGYSIKKNNDSTTSIIMVAFTSLLGNVITALLYILLILDKGVVASLELVITQFKSQLDIVKELYIETGAPQELIQRVEGFKDIINLQNLVIIIPITLLISNLVSAYLNYLITEIVLKRLNYEVKDIIPFSRIYIPNKFAALLIIFQCIGIILYAKGIGFGSYISTIGGILVQAAFTLGGVAYFAFLLREKAKVPKGLTAVILVVTLFIPIFMNAFVMIGLMDIMFNLRGLDPDPIRIKKSRK